MVSIKRRLLFIAAAIFASHALPAAAQDKTPVKIGFHAGLTGPAAADGLSAEIAVKLAVEEANKAGGINGRPIELVVYDDQGKPDQAVPVANKLIGDKVVAVISAGFSAPTKAAAPVFQEAHIPYVVAIALQPDITKSGDYVFRVGSMGEVEGRAGAKLIGDVLKAKSIVLLTIKTDFGKTVAAGLKGAADKFSFKVVKEYEYSPGDRQFGPMIASIKEDKPDLIYASGFYFTGGPLLSQIRAAGINVPFVGAQSYSSSKFIEIAGAASDGAIITNVIDWSGKTPQEKAFFEAFEKKAGFRPEAAGSQAYASAEVLIAGLRAAKSIDSVAIRTALAATKMHTVVGDLSFNSLHEVQRSFPVSIVKDGKWQSHGVIEDPVLLAPPTQ
ncbi:MAG: ABC transporter substrate-binding protein [Rhizobiales bacterium]|nr:ABC transporter substrate-binding protein [Hyphomicrobiales bacterium]